MYRYQMISSRIYSPSGFVARLVFISTLIATPAVWASAAWAQEAPDAKPAASAPPAAKPPSPKLPPLPADAHVEQTAEINGKTLRYTVTVGTIPVYDRDGKKTGEVVYTAYTMEGKDRP